MHVAFAKKIVSYLPGVERQINCSASDLNVGRSIVQHPSRELSCLAPVVAPVAGRLFPELKEPGCGGKRLLRYHPNISFWATKVLGQGIWDMVVHSGSMCWSLASNNARPFS